MSFKKKIFSEKWLKFFKKKTFCFKTFQFLFAVKDWYN